LGENHERTIRYRGQVENFRINIGGQRHPVLAGRLASQDDPLDT
jgi:hypothetical protein